MLSTTSTGLLIGLGLRIALDKVQTLQNLSHTPSAAQNLLLGTWQGVLLYQVFLSAPYYLSGVCGGVGARFLLDLFVLKDAVHSTRSLIGVVLGILLAGICSQLWNADQRDFEIASRKRSHQYYNRHYKHPSRKRHSRSLGIPNAQLDVISEEGSDLSSLARDHHELFKDSEIEVQINSLRSRATAADGDRRRFQEERKWAISQGNWARAGQLEWQIWKYEALRDSYNREAKRWSMELKRNATQSRLPTPPQPVATDHLAPQGAKALHEKLMELDKPIRPPINTNTMEPQELHLPSRPSSAPPITPVTKEPFFIRPVVIIGPPENTPYIAPYSTFQRYQPRSRTKSEPSEPRIPLAPLPTRNNEASPPSVDPRDAFKRFLPRTKDTVLSDSMHHGHGPGYGLLNYIDASHPIRPLQNE